MSLKQTQINLLLNKLTAVRFPPGGNFPLGTAREDQLLKTAPSADIPNPFHALPNVRSSWIKGNQLDPLLARYGIASKFSPELEFESLSRRLKACNRYLRIMHYRLISHLAKADHYSFWILALYLMRDSKVIRLVALRKLEHNWHTQFKFATVKVLLQRLEQRIRSVAIQMYIRRDYADKIKSDGTVTHRPIGNPSLPDRMYLYIWQCFFVMYLYSYIGRYQHGFLPGRGTLTAWKQIKRLAALPFVYEYDLKGAFPSVSIAYARDRLKALNCPAPIADFIYDMSLVTVEQVDRSKQKLPEPKFDRQEFLGKALDMVWNVDSGQIPGTPPSKSLKLWDRDAFAEGVIKYIWNEDSRDTPSEIPPDVCPIPIGLHDRFGPEQVRFIEATAWAHGYERDSPKLIAWCQKHPSFPLDSRTEDDIVEVLARFQRLIERDLKSHGFTTVGPDFIDAMRAHAQAMDLASSSKEEKAEIPIEQRGFPQGSGLSPILFDFMFEDVIHRNWLPMLNPKARLVAYADDFIVFCREKISNFLLPIEATPAAASGLTLSYEKSRPIKEDGLWDIKGFKFLGIRALPFGKELILSGETRKGSTLRMDADKSRGLSSYIKRDYELRRFSKALELGSHPQAMLDGWGRSEHPFDLIPESIIQGTATFKASTLEAIRKVVSARETPGESQRVDPKTGLLAQKIAAMDFDAIAQSLTDASTEGYARLARWLSRSQSTRWLGSRKAGLILSRLYDGKWHRAADNSSSFDLLKSCHSSTRGRSWFELANRQQLQHKGVAPNLHNSTSLAMFDLITLARHPRSIKIGRDEIKYKFPKSRRAQTK